MLYYTQTNAVLKKIKTKVRNISKNKSVLLRIRQSKVKKINKKVNYKGVRAVSAFSVQRTYRKNFKNFKKLHLQKNKNKFKYRSKSARPTKITYLYVPCEHSARDVRKWEAKYNKKWYSLNMKQRALANLEIKKMKMNLI